MITAGILIGIVLGPGVLGQIAPTTYHGMFDSPQSRALTHVITQFKNQTTQQIQLIKGTGVSQAAVAEQLAQRQAKLATLQQARAQARDRRAVHLSTAILLALAAVMLVETFFVPYPRAKEAVRVPFYLSRLITVRYALIAGWLAVVLARPGLIASSTVALAVLIAVVALGVGLVPLGRVNKVTEVEG